MTFSIQADNLGKRYYLNQTVGHTLRRITARFTGGTAPPREEFWALDNLCFKIQPGESVGLIGPNGAGKSTLLKILSNVTKPTNGDLEVNGRVGALIEVGAGFHPQLTGRENIFLNGSILGMSKAQITAKFDDIVQFADLEKFIDTPVKRYSSGMFVRLGFAIAAHINPDILLIDEILAVGDHKFQKKCFEWVRSFRSTGKTFFLVSHNMQHIDNVCDRVLYIKHGKIAFDGPSDEAISLYMSDLNELGPSGAHSDVIADRVQVGDLQVTGIEVLNSDGAPTNDITMDEPLRVRVTYEAPSRIAKPKIEVCLNCEGMRIGQANTLSDSAEPEFLHGEGCITFSWPRCFLTPNRYSLGLFIADGDTYADLIAWPNARQFQVLAPKGFKVGSGKPGLIKIPGQWSYSCDREAS